VVLPRVIALDDPDLPVVVAPVVQPQAGHAD
jgi:hypothetical protein